MICLQEVFWGPAQEILKKALLPHFPHIIDRTGKGNKKGVLLRLLKFHFFESSFSFIVLSVFQMICKTTKEAFGVGVTAGLFIASRSPIEFSAFYPFEVGIGSDSLASKVCGLLFWVSVCKVFPIRVYCWWKSNCAICTLQSRTCRVIQMVRFRGNFKGTAKQKLRKVVTFYVFVAKFFKRKKISSCWSMSNDCSSVLSDFVGAGKKTVCLRSCSCRNHKSDFGTKKKKTRVFQRKVSQFLSKKERRVRGEQEQWASSTLIPHLADLINAGKIPVVYAKELLAELVSRGFQIRFLGPLRSAVTDRRTRSLLLIVMIARVLQQELWQLMREKVFADKTEEQKTYVELCLRYFETVSGLKSHSALERASMSSSAPALSRSSATLSHSSDLGSSGDAPRLGGSMTDVTAAQSAQQQQQQHHQHRLIDRIFDKELVRRIHHMFGPFALDETTESHASYLCAEVSWFQLLRYVQHLFGVLLATSTEIHLLKQGPRALEYPDDVVNASMDVFQVNADWDASEKLQIERTEEFRELLQVFGNPRDAFREKNPAEFGSDATLEHAHQEEARRHQVLVFDSLPDGKTELLKLRTVSCTRPLLMGDSGATTDLLSGVPAVEVVLKPTVEGFEMLG